MTHPPFITINGDNQGVIDAWKQGRSRNAATNSVFRRIHEICEENQLHVHARYVPSAANLADGPLRGIFPPDHLVLPPITLPTVLQRYLSDFNQPPQAPIKFRPKRPANSLWTEEEEPLIDERQLSAIQHELTFAESPQVAPL